MKSALRRLAARDLTKGSAGSGGQCNTVLGLGDELV